MPEYIFENETHIVLGVDGWRFPDVSPYKTQETEFNVCVPHDLMVVSPEGNYRTLRANTLYPIVGYRLRAGLEVMLVDGQTLADLPCGTSISSKYVGNSWLGKRDHDIAYQVNAMNRAARRHAMRHKLTAYPYYVGNPYISPGEKQPDTVVAFYVATKLYRRQANGSNARLGTGQTIAARVVEFGRDGLTVADSIMREAVSDPAIRQVID